MKITIKVIEDLLPLYFDDELSTDSREIVEEYFKQNPDFEKKFVANIVGRYFSHH